MTKVYSTVQSTITALKKDGAKKYTAPLAIEAIICPIFTSFKKPFIR